MHLLIKCSLLIYLLAIPLLTLGQTDSSVTCSGCCCADDPTPAGVMISHIHKKNQWMFSYRFMTMSMSDMQVGRQKVNDNYVFQNYLMSSKNMRMNMHMLMAMYGLSNRLTLMGMLQYLSNSMEMSMLPGTNHYMEGMNMGEDNMDMKMKSQGLGDLKINALYGIINKDKHHLLASIGISIPTGTIYNHGDNNSMYANLRLPYSMQLGSGTVDLLPVISYLHYKEKFSWSSQVSSVLRTGHNALGYKLGNEISINNWFAYKWTRNFSSSLRIEGSFTDFIDGKDKMLYAGYEPAANPYNYGGQRANAYLGTNFYFRTGILDGNKIGIEYGLPFYQNLNGPQMRLKSTLNVSWAITLN